MKEKEIKKNLRHWRQIIKKYQHPNTRKAVIQLINTFLPFIGIWILMYFSLDWHYGITLVLAVVNALFLVRIFIIQHDCGHHSFLKSHKWNNLVGLTSSIFSSIPFESWAYVHNVHHGHNGQLEHRGLGDIGYLTSEEYTKLPGWRKLWYRFYRNPVMTFLIIPFLYLTIDNRFPFHLNGKKKISWAQLQNNVIIVAVYIGLALLIGWKQFLMIHVPIVFVFIVIAFWFFYVQHQHEENYKQWKGNWDFLMASICGSTYYKLPGLFQWFSGSIGFHHIHHLSSRIPNYNLGRCASDNPILNKYVTVVNFQESLKYLSHRLWDEKNQRMITLKQFKEQKNYKRTSEIRNLNSEKVLSESQ